MKILSAASIFLISSKISAAFGSSIQRSQLEQKEQRQQQHIRALQLRSREAVGDSSREEPMDDVINELFRDISDESYDRIANFYNQLSIGIDTALLQVNPDIDEEDLLGFREAFVDFLEDDNDVSEFAGITEGDGGDEVDIDTLEKVEGGLVGNDGGRQRGWSQASYHKYWNKGCRDKHRGKGRSGYDYDLYRHSSHEYCKSKCNGLGNHCYGYEYSSHSDKCEIWWVPIHYADNVHGLDCYVKN